jgi:hypothetical protein
VSTDYLYLRLIRDRNISENDFSKIQTDRVSEMKNWVNILRRSQEEDRRIKLAIVAGTIIIRVRSWNRKFILWYRKSSFRELGAKIGTEIPF